MGVLSRIMVQVGPKYRGMPKTPTKYVQVSLEERDEFSPVWTGFATLASDLGTVKRIVDMLNEVYPPGIRAVVNGKVLYP